MSKKDYYEILGVNDNASNDEIKNNYRGLAKKYHPDVNKGDKAAESKFKDISEAYNVLRDSEKRKKYDHMRKYGTFGGGAPGGFDFGPFGQQSTSSSGRGGGFSFDDLFGFGGLGDIFGDVFDRSSSSRRERGHKGSQRQQLQTDLVIPFDLAINGGKKVINVTLEEPCESCRGTGAERGSTPKTCPHCQGRGTISIAQGFFSVNRPCPHCYGRGIIIEKPCTKCNGAGEIKKTKKLAITIPPGTDSGKRLRLRGQGAAEANGGAKGDIIINFQVTPHRFFRRQGDDIFCEVPLDIIKAIKGTNVRVNTVYGKKVEIKVPEGTKDGKIFRLKELGVKSKTRAGNQYVTIRLKKRNNLNKEEQEIIEEFNKNNNTSS